MQVMPAVAGHFDGSRSGINMVRVTPIKNSTASSSRLLFSVSRNVR